MPRGVLYLAFACSGAAALIYETTWTRLLTLFMGHTVAAASTVLAAFMGGLAIGAAVAGRVAPAMARTAAIRAYAGIEILIALAAVALPFELELLRPLVAGAYADGNGGATFGFVRLVCALAVVTIPAIAMGATLPLVVRWDVLRASRAGLDTGLLYAANTVGAALGAVLAGFVLLPTQGMRRTTLVGVGLNVVSAGIAWWLAAAGELAPSRLTASAEATAVHRSFARRWKAAPTTDHTPAPTMDHTADHAAETPPHKRGHLPETRGSRPETRGGRLQAARGRLTSPPTTDDAASPRVAALALAISGCVSLILQIAWTRILALTVGPTTFAFSAMVATFIAGIALGSIAGGWLASAARKDARRLACLLAGSLLVSGLAALAASWWAPRMPLLIADVVAAPDASFATVVRLQSALIAALMMPMTVAFGAAFPLAVALAARDDQSVPGDVATVYTANTMGAIAGALGGGFLLVPSLGLQNTSRVAAALAVAGFAMVAIGHARGRKGRALALGVAAAAAAAIVLLPPWDRELLSSGAYKYAPYMPAVHRDVLLRAGSLLYYREGAVATVSVRRVIGTLSLAIDGKVDASNAGDMLTQRLLAHVPLLLHPAPARVGIIGLGSGVTLGSALRHPITHADVLEISPEVVEASAFFARENHDALKDPRTRLIVGDGRSHLALGRQQYDVIISEPSNPWMAGVAALFTREFFEAAKARLAPGGLLCQWAHTYDISDADLRSIAATFTSAFPHTSLWLVGEGDILLIGSTGPLEPALTGIRSGWNRPGVAADLKDVDVADPDSLLALFAADTERLKEYAGQASVQHDDRMALEFSGPRGIYGRLSDNNATTLRSLASDGRLPAIVREARQAGSTLAGRGAMHLRAEAYQSAWDDLAGAVQQDPANSVAIERLLRAAPAANRTADTERLLGAIVKQNPRHVGAAVALSRLIASRGDFTAAAEPLRPLFNGPVADVPAMAQLASIFSDAGDQARLASIVGTMRRVAPDDDSTIYFTASLHFMAGRMADAAREGERLRAGNAGHARNLNLLGATYASLGRRDDARRAFEASVGADPRDATTYANLGTFELEQGNPQAAADCFAEALTVDPSSQQAQDGLSRALAALQR